MEYNASSPQTGSIIIVSDGTAEVAGDDGSSPSRALIVWYLIGLITILMISVLIVSFCKYHKRQKRKKRHNHDYIRANLPLIRPRILPPSMNMGTDMGHNHLRYERKVFCERSYIGYTSVATEDIFESQINVQSSSTDQNLIDLNNIELKDFSSPTDITVHANESCESTYYEDFADFENMAKSRASYRPTFRPVKSLSTDFTSNIRSQDSTVEEGVRRTDKDRKMQCFKSNEYKLFNLPRHVAQTMPGPITQGVDQ